MKKYKEQAIVHWKQIFGIGFLILFAFSTPLNALNSGYDQISLTWGTWRLTNESVLPGQGAYLEFNYTGQTASIGFWDINPTPPSLGLKYSIELLSSGNAYFYQDGSVIAYYPSLISPGDVVSMERTTGGMVLLYVNGVSVGTPQNLDVNLELFPYLDETGVPQKNNLFLFVEDLENYPATWVKKLVPYQIASEVLERGKDGYLEYTFAGEDEVRLEFAKGKTKTLGKSAIRVRYVHSTKKIFFYLNGSYSGLTTLSTGLVAGDKMKIQRKGSNFFIYAKDLKWDYTTDGNIALHPIIREYSGTIKENVRISFRTQGGGCADYFDNKSSYFNIDQSPHYPAANNQEARNYVHTKIYDGSGEKMCQVLSESRSYVDDLGRPTQSQSKDYLTGKVWTTETLYDQQGRAAISTLAAPTGKDFIEYKNDFVLDESGNPYDHNDFEVALNTDSPDPIGAQVNSLGWWYSSNNVEEPWQATTQFPFSHTAYSEITGAPVKTAGPGDYYHMGQGREAQSYGMQAASELDYLFRGQKTICALAGSSYDVGGNIANQCATSDAEYIKQISIDPDGKHAVVFNDQEGNEVARCLSGQTGNKTSVFQNISITLPLRTFRDIHVTAPDEVVSFTPPPGKTLIYQVFDLQTGKRIYPAPSSDPTDSGNSPTQTLNTGVYRVVNNANGADLTIAYKVYYYNFSLNIYNTANQMVATVAPNDIIYSLDPAVKHNAFSLYKYNSIGQLIWEETPDAGRTEYYYRKDGLLRFSRNAIQLDNGSFAYSKYDRIGRVTESGICTTLPTDLNDNLLLDDNDYPGVATFEKTNTVYDIPVTGSGRTQHFVRGKISATYNLDASIWYSYDEQGRLGWTAHQIDAYSVKITDYKYDLLGNVTEVAYQEGNGVDELHHHYTYDSNSQLRSASTKHNIQISAPADLQAQYSYTPSGALDQKTLADGLENQHFAYTLQGQLKAINPEDMELSNIAEGGNNTFSMALDYYKNDFIAANGSRAGRIYSLYTGSNCNSPNCRKAQANHSGNIVAQRWKTRANFGAQDYTGHYAYVYSYTHRNELIDAKFGKIKNTTNTSFDGLFNLNDLGDNYYRMVLSANENYDDNGNILRLHRYNAGAKIDDLTYTYNKTNGKNQLTRINDSATGTGAGTLGDLVDQGGSSTTNYLYSEMGQLELDFQEKLKIEYDSYGRVKNVYDTETSVIIPKVTYLYDPGGQRVAKRSVVIPSPGTTTTTTIFYSRAAGGQLQAIYKTTITEGVGTGSAESSSSSTPDGLQEMPIYGAGRLGVAYYQSSIFSFHYEVGDHLGNVRAVLKKDVFGLKELVSYTDYYPFGWELPGRNYQGAENYRYGFQGQYAEADEETGWSAFELRSYDARVGRWMSIDPMEEFWSPYLAFGNTPHQTTDPTGGSTENEYTVDLVTGERNMISTLGGDEFDIVHYGYAADNGGFINVATSVSENPYFSDPTYYGSARLGIGDWAGMKAYPGTTNGVDDPFTFALGGAVRAAPGLAVKGLGYSKYAFLRANIELRGVATESSKALFFSGLSSREALKYATTNGLKTLNQTGGGSFLQKQMNSRLFSSLKGTKYSQKLWARLSTRFADKASGTANAIHGQSIRINSIWRKNELGALLNNPNVTNIIIR